MGEKSQYMASPFIVKINLYKIVLESFYVCFNLRKHESALNPVIAHISGTPILLN